MSGNGNRTGNRGTLRGGPPPQVSRRVLPPPRKETEVEDLREAAITRPPGPFTSPKSMLISVETEFYLMAQLRLPGSPDVYSLPELIKAYNERPESHLRMRERSVALPFGDNRLTWGITKYEGSVARPQGPYKLMSPDYSLPFLGGWRDGVKDTWKFFQNRFAVDNKPGCGSHVKIAIYNGYTFDQQQRLAQAIIHFESAFLGLMPSYHGAPSHNGLDPAKSILLSSPRIKGLTRPDAIDLVARTFDADELVQLIHHDRNDRHYSWNFLAFLEPPTVWGNYVEFRQPPGTTSAEEFIAWGELAMLFVGAALQQWDWKKLKTASSSIHALYQFIEKSDVPRHYTGLAWKKLWILARNRKRGVDQALRRENVLGRFNKN